MHETYGSRGTLQVISRIHGSMANVKQYVAEHEIVWPVICCSSGNGEYPDAFAREYGVRGYPNAVLIDPEGRIVATRLWGIGWKEEMTWRVREAIKGVPVPAPGPND